METYPATPFEVLMLPGTVLLFGVLVYGIGLANGLREGVPSAYRWAGVGLLALAAVIGFLTVNHLFGPTGEFYRAMLTGKVLYAHYAALAAPLLALAVVPVAEAWFRRSQQDVR